MIRSSRRERRGNRLLFGAVALVAVVLLLGAGQAQAGFALMVGATTINDNGPGDLLPQAGLIGFSGTSGAFTINVETGTSKPVIGGPNLAVMDLSSLNVSSTAGGTLTIELTDTGFTFPGSNPVNFKSTVTGQVLTGTGSFSWQTYFNPNNTMFSTTGPGVVTTGLQTGQGSVTTSGPLAAPFSVTEILTITANAGGASFSFDNSGQGSPVPEPGSILLAISALPAMAGGLFLRRLRGHA